MQALMVLHVAAASIWLGCVAVEVFFERALAPQPENRALLAKLHYNVDLFVEAPAFLVTALSGAILFSQATPGLALDLMIGLGAVAVLANIWCVLIVIARRRHALAGAWAAYARADHRLHKVGSVVALGVAGAMLAGFGNVM
jgi:hypothetical protein